MADRKVSKKRADYIEEWTKENRDRLLLRLPKGDKARIKVYSDALHMSTTHFINCAIEEFIAKLRAESDDEFVNMIDEMLDELEKDS